LAEKRGSLEGVRERGFGLSSGITRREHHLHLYFEHLSGEGLQVQVDRCDVYCKGF